MKLFLNTVEFKTEGEQNDLTRKTQMYKMRNKEDDEQTARQNTPELKNETRKCMPKLACIEC